MSQNDNLEPDILELLKSEKAIPPLASATHTAMLSAVQTKLATLPAVGSGGPSAGKTMAVSHWKAALGLFSAFAIGSATTAILLPTKERVVTVERAPTPVPRAEENPPPTPAIPSVAVESLPLAPTHQRASAAEPSSRARGSERALLDVARTALANGEPDAALDACNRHASDYARGALVEEREAIAVRALVLAGRMGEAQRRGDRFLLAYPRSLMRDPVESALRNRK